MILNPSDVRMLNEMGVQAEPSKVPERVDMRPAAIWERYALALQQENRALKAYRRSDLLSWHALNQRHLEMWRSRDAWKYSCYLMVALVLTAGAVMAYMGATR
jgi:hypothetical protein